jgi:hypothetical protein
MRKAQVNLVRESIQHWKKGLLAPSVVDLDPVGFGTFCLSGTGTRSEMKWND